MGSILQDLQYAVRMMLKNPGITTIAILTLAVGIGVNTTIFSVVDALVFRPFPFKDFDRIMTVWTFRKGRPDDREGSAPADYLDWLGQNTTFERLAAYSSLESGVNITGIGHPEYVERAKVSPNFFQTLGVTPAMGRDFLAEEDTPGKHRVALVSHTLWQRRFDSAPDFVGKTMMLNGETATVIGILPPGHHYPLECDVWTPLAWTTEQRGGRAQRDVAVIGRLKPGVSEEEAQAEIETLWNRAASQFPLTHTDRSTRVISFRRQNGDSITEAISYALLGAVGFVLLIACANVANLQLARAATRRREIAIRVALGANRRRVLRQLLTESVAMSVTAGVLGILMAYWGIDLIQAMLPQQTVRFVPMWVFMGVDLRALAFTAAAVILTGVVSGLAPALRASRADLNEALTDGRRGSSGGAEHRRLRNGLVVAEVALALVMLVGVGMMVQGFIRLIDKNPGFDRTHLLTMRITLSPEKYSDMNQATGFYRTIHERLAALPGVAAVGGANFLPADNNFDTVPVEIEGRPALKETDLPRLNRHVVSAGYMTTLRIPLLQGRYFGMNDDEQAGPVAIVSRSLANRYWPGQDPVGRRLKIDATPSVEGVVGINGPWRTVVGVVEDAVYFWFDQQPRETVYLTSEQAPRRWMNLLIRTTGDPAAIASAIRSEAARIDPDQAVADIRTMETVIDDRMTGLRIAGWLMGIFGLIALVMAGVGIYGVMAYSVAQRTQEFGIRMAIGAGQTDVLRMVLRQGAVLSGLGLAIGIPAAYALSMVLQSGLSAIFSFDLTPFMVFTPLLIVVSAVASLLPAFRATKVDPVVALRSE